MSDSPTVSIVLHLDHQRHLDRFARAMESILAQDFVQWELIIVNTLSSSATGTLAARYLPDRRITHVRSEYLSGPYGAIEEGFSVARAPYVTALPGDAFFVPGALRRLHDATLVRPEAPVIYGRYSRMTSSGDPSSAQNHVGWAPATRAVRRSDFADLLRFGCYVSLSASLIKRALFDLYSFNTNFHLAEYDLFARFAQDGVELFFIDELMTTVVDEAEQPPSGSTRDACGLMFRDQLALLERCVVPANYDRLLGYEDDLLSVVASRRSAVERNAPLADRIVPQMEARMAAVVERIRRMGDEAARIPRDSLASAPYAAFTTDIPVLPGRADVPAICRKERETTPPAMPVGLAFAGESLDEVFRVTLRIAESGRIAEAIRYYDARRRFFPKSSSTVGRSLFMPLSHLETYDQQVEQLRAFLAGGKAPG